MVVPNNSVEEDEQFIVSAIVIYLSLLNYLALTIGIIRSYHLGHNQSINTNSMNMDVVSTTNI